MIGHKTSLNKFKKIEDISAIYLDNEGLELELTPRKKLKNTQTHGDGIACC